MLIHGGNHSSSASCLWNNMENRKIKTQPKRTPHREQLTLEQRSVVVIFMSCVLHNILASSDWEWSLWGNASARLNRWNFREYMQNIRPPHDSRLMRNTECATRELKCSWLLRIHCVCVCGGDVCCAQQQHVYIVYKCVSLCFWVSTLCGWWETGKSLEEHCEWGMGMPSVVRAEVCERLVNKLIPTHLLGYLHLRLFELCLCCFWISMMNALWGENLAHWDEKQFVHTLWYEG